MNDAGQILLDKLILSYEIRHGKYSQNLKEFRVILTGLVLCIPVYFIGAYLLGIFETLDKNSKVIGAFLLFVICPVYLGYQMKKSQRELNRIKFELEDVGFRIVCKDLNNPRLYIIPKEQIKEDFIKIPLSKSIDFKEYNRIFDL